MQVLLATRAFTSTDQRWFATASGDHNPMHVDPVAARRTMFGQTVVHGMHVALWALDQWCRSDDRVPTRVVVMFAKPVFLDEEVTLVAESGDGHARRLRVMLGQATLTSIRVETGSRAETVPTPDSPKGFDDHRTPGEFNRLDEPNDFSTEELDGRHGRANALAPAEQWRESFPALGAAIGGAAIGELAATSTIVGMHCPGLHSVFGSLDARITPSSADDPAVTYRVSRVETGLSAVRMDVTGSQMMGTVSAFVRPAPVTQPSMDEIASVVDRGEFEGVRAMIVGGSRGLGEVAAKLIAAGGGHVVITWRHGQHDAHRVAGEIRSAGGSVEVLRLDTDDPGVPADLANGLTHLYFFASPRITARRLASFDMQAFQRFVEVYVNGFRRVADAVSDAGASGLRVLYPSSVFVDDCPADVVEYAAAKAAGEVSARAWADSRPATSVVITRLPKLSTDQTATRSHDHGPDVMTTLVDVCRHMNTRHMKP
jgi:acyl dehydratase